MDITIANKRAIITGNTSDTIFSQALTTLNFTADTAIADNTTVALITPTGTALARATITANTATLDTNTVECYDYVSVMPVNGSKVAYLVIGEADSIIGVAEVYVARNALADITPPTASVPIYPTSQELQAILATLQEAIDRVGEIENIVEGFDETVQEGIGQINTATTDGIGSINALVDGFDTTVQEAVTQVNNATQSGTEAINATTQQGTSTITNATTSATTTISNATTQATTTIDNKVDAFNILLEQDLQEIANSVTEAEGARDEAETAKNEAESARDEAVIALNNGCLYTPFASNHITTTTETDDDGNTITVYTLKPSKEKTLFSFNDFVSNSKIKIDWSNFSGLWNEMIVVWIRGFIWDTAIENIIFDESIKWLGNTPFLTTNSETLLAITWNPRLPSISLANVQYERSTITGEPL